MGMSGQPRGVPFSAPAGVTVVTGPASPGSVVSHRETDGGWAGSGRAVRGRPSSQWAVRARESSRR
jgi:hypothetical protein